MQRMCLGPWRGEGPGSYSEHGFRWQNVPKAFQVSWIYCGWGATGHSDLGMCHGWLPQQLPELWCNRMADNALGKQALSLGKHTLPQNLFHGSICKQSGTSILVVNILHQIPAQPSSKAWQSKCCPAGQTVLSPGLGHQHFTRQKCLSWEMWLYNQAQQQRLQFRVQKTTEDLILPTWTCRTAIWRNKV